MVFGFGMLDTAGVVQLLRSVIWVSFGCCEAEISPVGYIGGECWELSIICSVSQSWFLLSSLTSLPWSSCSRHSTVFSKANPSLTASQLAENSLGLAWLLLSIRRSVMCAMFSDKNVKLSLTSGGSGGGGVCGRARGSTETELYFPGACHGPGPACAQPGERLRGSSSPSSSPPRQLSPPAGLGWAPVNILVRRQIIYFLCSHRRAVAESSLGDCSTKKNCIKRVRKERFKDKW